MSADREIEEVARRYARRERTDLYNLLRPDVWQTLQERQREMLRLFARIGWTDLSTKRLAEVGCGGGANLLEMLRLGFLPKHLSGAELLPDRYSQARRVLPLELALHAGDALLWPLAAHSQDIVLFSTVFSSLLDNAFQQRLADAAWQWTKPGGGVLWYDFTMNNPHNADVRGVPVERIRTLFPEGEISFKRVTLAPPIARRVTRVHPSLYTAFNLAPMLRSHVLAWIPKKN